MLGTNWPLACQFDSCLDNCLFFPLMPCLLIRVIRFSNKMVGTIKMITSKMTITLGKQTLILAEMRDNVAFINKIVNRCPNQIQYCCVKEVWKQKRSALPLNHTYKRYIIFEAESLYNEKDGHVKNMNKIICCLVNSSYMKPDYTDNRYCSSQINAYNSISHICPML